MGQDLRELFKENKEENFWEPPKDHIKRFNVRLKKNFPGKERKSQPYLYWIAASLILLVAIGNLMPKIGSGNIEKVVSAEPEKSDAIYLSDISPEYKKVENYYLAAIHTELAQLKITKENKALIDSFMEQLAELDEEYKRLNKELKVAGVNEQTVSVLIENLKLRMDLLFKLKNKLSELKKPASATI
ncbi:MAG TPA: hypothetical protein VFM82_10780 [Flavobacteriaceae bacterium]|nr:hypothetical protein [Flavobacteriaceae bacterium]